MKILSNGKKINLSATKVAELQKFIGLMFKSRNTKILLFEFERKFSIHSFFVFFKFLAVWLDEKNKVLKYEVVNPFTPLINCPEKARKLVEIPINDENKSLIKNIVGKGKI